MTDRMSSTQIVGGRARSERRGITGHATRLSPYDRHQWWARLALRYLKRHAPEYLGHTSISRFIGEIHTRRYLHTNEWYAARRILCDDECCMLFIRGTLYQVPREIKRAVDELIIDERLTQLYRHFDKDGIVLYVGISLSTIGRLSQHKTDSAWFNKISRVEIETHSSLGAATHAERMAIMREAPIYNRSKIAPSALDPVTAAEKLCKRYAIDRF